MSYADKFVASSRKKRSAFKMNDEYVNKQANKALGPDVEGVSTKSADAGSGMSTDKAVAAAGIAQKLGILPGGGQEGQTMDQSQGAMGGAVSGAMMGAQVGGPWGAAIGGVAGAVQGAASARAAAKAHNRAVEAKKHQALAEIEMKKGEQMSSAIQNMASRMSIR